MVWLKITLGRDSFKNIGAFNLFNPSQESESNNDPHGVMLNSKLKSFIRFSYYNLDFVLGHFFKIIPHKIMGRFVVFDRYYYDYFADTHRYQLRISNFFIKLFSFLIPKPDLIFRSYCKTRNYS